ncbi:MAG: hypothetical protein CME65_01810 [Halobacteriovoraceae bacterium]|nr:hypothetical protein [Halobacteriovoraceae bacterium]|tara:strand:+ start:1683 stop:1913 length:231 start_codon:yes stop_codon:yes gene_type:complete
MKNKIDAYKLIYGSLLKRKYRSLLDLKIEIEPHEFGFTSSIEIKFAQSSRFVRHTSSCINSSLKKAVKSLEMSEEI